VWYSFSSRHMHERPTVTPPAKRDLLDTSASDRDTRKAERLAAIEYLRAVRPGVDHVLQELVDEVRGVFGTDLCMVNLNLSDVQYFRAWSGELHPDLAEARRDSLEHSMCRYVVNTEKPLVVEDFLATEELREQHWLINYGIRFYAGTPLVTSAGPAIGTLCLLNTRSVEFGEEQVKVLGAFARAVVGRLELLGALEREQAARVEEKQRSRELQRTLDSLSAYIAIVDESGEIVAVNDVWRKFAEANGGDPKKVAEGANYLQVCDAATGLHAEEAAAFASGIRAVLSGRQESFEMEYPCHSPTERRWFMGRVTRFSGSETRRAVIAHENITERKLAGEALQDQKVLLETILGQAADAIVVCDEGGRFTFANAAARRMALRDPEGATLDLAPEVLGVAHYPDGRPVPPEQWSITRALRGETTVGRETRMVRPDGTHYDVLISAAPLENAEGELVGAVASLLDITGRKKAEEHTLFQARLLDQVQAAVIATDMDGVVTHWSAHAERLYGFSREETLGRNISELTVGPTKAGLANEIMERLRSGETWEGEFTVRRKDGSTFPAYVIDSLIYDSRGREIGIVGVSTDITERRQAEEERVRLRDREIEVRTQREERRRIARDLHDVVLQDLSGALQSLRLTHLQARNSGLELDLEEELEALGRATSGLRSAMYDLRHEGERPFVKSVESLVELSRQLSPERKISLVVEEGFPEGLAGELSVQLSRILQEALTNARRHSGARSVEVRLRTEDGAVLAAVIDDGRGFDRASPRAGVGLSTMRERVEALGGEIEVQSQLGKGTKVALRVPLEGGTRAPRRL
jgi:PAS domain S-box-containing protein